MPQKIEISYKTIIFTLAVLIGLWLLFLIRDIILLLFVSLIATSAIHSPVDWLEKKKIPRAAAILAVYFVIAGVIGAGFAVIIPPLVVQSANLVSSFPELVARINQFFAFYNIPYQNIVESFQKDIGSLGQNLFRFTAGVFSGLFAILTLIVFTFYLLLKWQDVVRLFSSPFSGQREGQVKKLLIDVETGLGRWVRGEIILALVIGTISYLGLVILGVPNALPLAVVAGLFEVIPIIGPIISAIPAILAGFLISPFLALAVAALYFIIQQLENNLIVPAVMSKAVGLNPLVTIIALMIGAKLAGIMGAILAVPTVVLLKILFTDIAEFTKEGSEGF